MITVSYDEQDGTKTLGVVEAAERHYEYVVGLKGQDWIDKFGYTKDHALMDFLCGNYGWLESEGRKLAVQEDDCCEHDPCCYECEEECQQVIDLGNAMVALVQRLEEAARHEVGSEILAITQAISNLQFIAKQDQA